MGCCRRVFHGKEIMKVEWYVIFDMHGFQTFMCKPHDDSKDIHCSDVVYTKLNGIPCPNIVPKFIWHVSPVNLITFKTEEIAIAVAEKYAGRRGCGYQIAYTFSN